MPPRVLALPLACLLLLAGCSSDGGDLDDFEVRDQGLVASYSEQKRRPAPPDFGGPLLTGTGVLDASFIRGKVSVVNFWASWCGPCRREQPVLKRLAERYQPKGVRFVGIDTRRDQKAAALAFLDEFGIWSGGPEEPVYPSIHDPSSKNAFRFRLSFMPATYVIDERYRIAAVIAGGLPNEQALASILDAEIK